MWRAANRLGAATLRARRGAAKPPLPPLLFFTDPARTPNAAATIARLPRGAGVVYRAFGAVDAVRVGLALLAVARRRRLVFLVGADVALALRLGADGVHLPERDAHRPARHRRLPRKFLVTRAGHSLAAARQARRAGADAVVVSPVFASASPSAGRALGVRRFTGIVRAGGLPAYALGGIDRSTVPALAGSAAAGLAAVAGLGEAGGGR